MDSEKTLTNLQTIQLSDISFIAEMADDPEPFDHELLTGSEELKRNKDEQCRNDLSVDSENSPEVLTKNTNKCEECGKKFKTEFRLKNHLYNHSLKQSFECGLCSKTFKRNSVLKAHQREVHASTKQYSCDQCSYATNNKTNYNTHVTVRHGDVNLIGIKCELCDKKFFRKEEIMCHKIKEHNAPRFKCDLCDKSYTSVKYLQTHRVTHNPNFKLEHQCVECGKMFPNGGRLSSHIRIKHLGLKFVCQKCGKNLSSLTCLRDHMTQHSGAKPYRCDDCGKVFATRKYLRVHSRTHSGEKPYTCKECDKSFTQRTSLCVHIRRYHVSDKVYVCEVCLKGFVTSTLLKNHMKGHKTVIVEHHTTS